MTQLSAVTRRRVTTNWASRFPGFDVWKPMRLLRRIGPVLQGISLDSTTSGDDYFPSAHVHALTREFPVVSLGMNQRLVGATGVQERVSFARHDDEYRDAAERLRGQSRLSLDEPPTIEEIVAAYHGHAVEHKGKGYPPAVNEMEDCVLVAAVAGKPEFHKLGKIRSAGS